MKQSNDNGLPIVVRKKKQQQQQQQQQKNVLPATKHYLKAVSKSKRIQEKKSVVQTAQDEERSQRKRKWQNEQLYELDDPRLETKDSLPGEPARPMTMVLYELRQEQDERLVYTDILARGIYSGEQLSEKERDAYLSKQGHCALWSWQEDVVRFIEARESDEAGIHSHSLMLCLDMSLGKTICSLTYLLVDNQRCCRQTGRRFNGCTLIVCQNVLLVDNWLDEVRQKWPANSFQYHRLYTAKNRLISRFYIEQCCDFLIVTYATIKAAYRYANATTSKTKKEATDDEDEEDDEDEGEEEEEDVAAKQYKYEILYKIRWKRILADESHVFVNRATLLYRAMMALDAEIKWVITGTPIQNSLSDICSSFNFIGIPLGHRLEQYLLRDTTNIAKRDLLIEKIRETLAIVMIRRLKSEIPGTHEFSGKPLFMGVVKTVKLIEFETVQEKLVYYLYATYGSRNWKNLFASKNKADGNKVRTTSVASIIQLMMQLCLGLRIVDGLVLPHGLLTMRPYENERLKLRDTRFVESLFGKSESELAYQSNDHTLEAFASLLDKPTRFTYKSDASLFKLPPEYKIEYYASLSSEPQTDLTALEKSKNADSFEWSPFAVNPHFDLTRSASDRARYQLLYDHLCRTNQNDEAIRELAKECEDTQAMAMIDHLMARTLRSSTESSKNQHIIRYIQSTPHDDKVVIFSNSVQWLETMLHDLTQHQIGALVISSKTHRDYRDRIARFKNQHSGVKVLLLSFKLGNVGINIPEANIIIFADPWWNSNMREQAENRVQRPGQTKTVRIVYFVMNRTIDLYVLNLSYDKQYMTNSLMPHTQKEPEAEKSIHSERYAYNLYQYSVEQEK